MMVIKKLFFWILLLSLITVNGVYAIDVAVENAVESVYREGNFVISSSENEMTFEMIETKRLIDVNYFLEVCFPNSTLAVPVTGTIDYFDFPLSPNAIKLSVNNKLISFSDEPKINDYDSSVQFYTLSPYYSSSGKNGVKLTYSVKTSSNVPAELTYDTVITFNTNNQMLFKRFNKRFFKAPFSYNAGNSTNGYSQNNIWSVTVPEEMFIVSYTPQLGATRIRDNRIEWDLSKYPIENLTKGVTFEVVYKKSLRTYISDSATYSIITLVLAVWGLFSIVNAVYRHFKKPSTIFEHIAMASDEDLIKIEGIGEKNVKQIKESAKNLRPK